jgi:hypothetical protein
LSESDPQSAIRSVIPTASMPVYVGGAAPVAVPPAAAAAAIQSPVFPATGRPAENGSGVRPHPGSPTPYQTMLAGSPAGGVRPAPSADAVGPASPSSGPYPAVNGAAHAYAMQAVEPVRIAPTVPVMAAYTPAPAIETGPHAPLRAPSGIQYPSMASPSSATSPLPHVAPVEHDADDDFSIPGLPRRKLKSRQASGGRSTVATIIVSVIATLALGAGAVWILGLMPSQRRDSEVRDLMFRAEDAYRGHRYSHQDDESDVEDLTDAVLALSPQHARARELRSASALGLRNQAVELANGGHPDQALPLLQRALRLSDDPEIRNLLSQVQQAQQQPQPNAPNVAPPAPNGATAPPANAAPAHVGPAHPTHAHPTTSDPPVTNPNPAPQPSGPTFTPGGRTTPSTPTFTPGRDPNQPTPPRNPEPRVVRQPPAQPGPANPPPDNPPQMVGGPSQTDPTPPPQPPPDPNGGGTAF